MEVKHTCVDSINDYNSTVGRSYWDRFKKYNDHRVVTKKGENFKIDRQNWTTYSNFKLAHCSTDMEMADAGITVELEVDFYKDECGLDNTEK